MFRITYNGKYGYRKFIGFYKVNGKLRFTFKGLTFTKNK